MPADRDAATSIHIEPLVAPIITDEQHDEWLTLFANRDEVAEQYASMIRHNGVEWPGYRKINEAILRRWSPAGLRYIKEKAWKIAAA